jgi:hypothetical protein
MSRGLCLCGGGKREILQSVDENSADLLSTTFGE